MQDEEMEVEQPSAKKSPNKHKESEKIFAGKVGKVQRSSPEEISLPKIEISSCVGLSRKRKKKKSEHPSSGIVSENQSFLIFHKTRVCLAPTLSLTYPIPYPLLA